MNIKSIIKKALVLSIALGLIHISVSNQTVNATGAKFFASGTETTIIQRDTTASVTYTYSNEDGGIFRTIQATYEWNPDLMTFDSISGDGTHFEIVKSQPDQGYLELGLRYYAGVHVSEPTVTLNFKNCFADDSIANGTVATIKSGYIPKGNGDLTVNYVPTGASKYQVQEGEEEITDASVTLNLPISVEMDASNPTSIMKGQSGTFTASVTNDTTGVTWTLEGGSDSAINPVTGELTVGENETATSVTVKATSNKDSNVVATTKVAIDKKPGLSLSIDPTSKKVFKGEDHTVNFTATPTTTVASPTTVTYTLTGANHVDTTIDATTGELTIDKDETADELTVTATAVNNDTEEKTVTVTAKVSLVEISVVVNPSSEVVAKGDSYDFEVTVMNDLENDGVTWKLEGNKSDETTLEDGTLTVAKDETATSLKVIATSVKDSTKSAEANVTVVDAPEITITLDATNAEVKQGGTKQFKATVGTKARIDTSVTWKVDGATSKDTTIDANGLLSVGADEKVGAELIVTATATADTSKTATAKVVVTAKDKDDDTTNPTDPSKPTDPTKPTPSNPSKTPDKTTGTDVKASPTTDVKTGDSTNLGLLIMMLGVSGLGILIIKRKRA